MQPDTCGWCSVFGVLEKGQQEAWIFGRSSLRKWLHLFRTIRFFSERHGLIPGAPSRILTAFIIDSLLQRESHLTNHWLNLKALIQPSITISLVSLSWIFWNIKILFCERILRSQTKLLLYSWSRILNYKMSLKKSHSIASTQLQNNNYLTQQTYGSIKSVSSFHDLLFK